MSRGQQRPPQTWRVAQFDYGAHWILYCQRDASRQECTLKTIHVAAAIIMSGDKILAAQRGYGEFKGGWEFPGGKLEAGESGEQACIREIQEELDVATEDLELLYTAEHDYDSFHLSMDCFTCTIASGEIHDSEHQNLRWLDRDSLWSVDWLPADIKVVEALEAAFA